MKGEGLGFGDSLLNVEKQCMLRLDFITESIEKRGELMTKSITKTSNFSSIPTIVGILLLSASSAGLLISGRCA